MKKIEMELWIYILMIVVMAAGVSMLCYSIRVSKQQNSYIRELEQNEVEQAEEKEVYVNKCKMYEDLLEVNGLLDECECN